MTTETFKQMLLDELATALHDQPDALRWIFGYFNYAHKIDDIVDEEKNHDTIREAFALGEALFASPFWNQHGGYLYPVLRIVHFEYFVSVDWEKADEEWKRIHANEARHAGNSVAIAVVSLFRDDATVLALAKRLKEFSIAFHHDFQGEDTSMLDLERKESA